MITLLNKLYSYHENINKSIEEIINKNNTDYCSIEDCIREGLATRERIEDLDLFVLVEAIVLTSNRPIDGILKELEEKYTSWAKLLARFFINDYEMTFLTLEDNDDYNWIVNILEKNISSLNKIGQRYFNVSCEMLFSFNEYLVIATAQLLYSEKEKAYFELKHQNIVSEEDQIFMLTSQFDISMQDLIKSKKPTTVDFEVFSYYETEFIKKNDKIIKEKDFKISFIEGNINVKVADKLTDEQIYKLFAFLQSNDSIGKKEKAESFLKYVRHQNTDVRMFWEGSKVDAWRLIEFLGCKLDSFNDWFYFKDKNKLRSDRKPKVDNGSPFSNFLILNFRTN